MKIQKIQWIKNAEGRYKIDKEGINDNNPKLANINKQVTKLRKEIVNVKEDVTGVKTGVHKLNEKQL